MLQHLGITPEQLDAIRVLGISLDDAVTRGMIALPAWLSPDRFPQYLRHLRTIHEMGMTLQGWSDPALDEPLCEGSAEDVIRMLNEQACGS
jgi:hypothetical protein